MGRVVSLISNARIVKSFGAVRVSVLIGNFFFCNYHLFFAISQLFFFANKTLNLLPNVLKRSGLFGNDCSKIRLI